MMCSRLLGAAEKLRAVVFEFRRLVLAFPLTRSILTFSRIQIHPSESRSKSHFQNIEIFRQLNFEILSAH